ncbi:probable nitrate reductase [Cephalotrichum gorgonifer]|uniref:Nitrate reductase n=3 Tax=Microascaceae TaxID=5593 RepID=A0AAE8N8P9_9PEZI|nr:probable nitrate reductase [Cephalotrichum gorgonifer]
MEVRLADLSLSADPKSMTLFNYQHPEPTLRRTDLGIPLPASRPRLPTVLEKDSGTPDDHVPRDGRLIRLTGVHPFNAEAPLTPLYQEGFLTSVDLFYVRNHGAVPKVLDEDVMSWELSVEGLVENPYTITLKDLIQEFEQITMPITLVCAGNRRKEQNTVRKTKGFSWGSAGLSTALFTGTLLANLLKKAKPIRGAKYMCMEGADKLPNGYYGTSVKLSWAMDPLKGMMVAHGMNGEPLVPDHGRPLRVVVPGQIGGRSVKWLRRLIVTKEPSDNWYHYYDNKVLPTTVTPEQSAAEPAWWKDDRYSIYDLNVNSAVAYPQHNEVLSLDSEIQDYDIRGYAYGGGGRRITRVEISLNNGKSWRLADIDYPEDRYRKRDIDIYGSRIDMPDRDTSFCWCFWKYNVSVLDLQNSDSILVRAMDESMMTQPRDMYWSVLGMMNNPWFRIRIERGERSLRFEHPTSLSGPPGWMEKVKNEGGDLLNGRWGERSADSNEPLTPPPEEVVMTSPDVKRVFTIEEFRAESSDERPLFVILGEVYDGTGYLKDHPGGAQSIVAVAGTDATEDFMAIHSENAKAMMRDYHIGRLDDRGRLALQSKDDTDLPSPSRTEFLDPKHWTKAPLTSIRSLSWDTKVFTFKFENENQVSGLPVGQHLMMRVKDKAKGTDVLRAYTPISQTTRKGFLEVLIKLYLPAPGVVGGQMSMALDQLALNDMVSFKGPIGKFEYLGRGKASVSGKTRAVSSFTMICGGSGITPIYQVFRAVMQDAEDETRCTVLDGNRREEDILLREEIAALESGNESRCRVLHTLTGGGEGWSGLRGRICEELLRKEAEPVKGAMALICGPPEMEKSAREILAKMGWKDEDVLTF